MAGARDVVVSLWPVSDAAAADFMIAFHERLRAGQPASRALRGARLAMGHAGTAPAGAARGVERTSLAAERAHPSVWAAFVLNGAAPR